MIKAFSLDRLMPVIALFFMVSAQAAHATPRPNIVLIVGDDLGAMDLGCYGSKFHRTPNLDKLAAEGLRFTQAYAAAPVCSPTRVALITGQHPARVGLTDWLPGRANRPDQMMNRPEIPLQLPLEKVTMAEMLKAAGYGTIHVGKWHLGGEGFGPQQQGFDVNIAGDQTGTPLSYFAPFKNNQGRFMPGLEVAKDGEYLTDRLTDEALKQIDRQVAEQRPFLLYMPHYAPHTPMRAKADLIKGYDPAGIPGGRQRNPIYAAMLQSLDESVGRVLRKLEEKGIAENTWVIFTSDNGGLATTEGPNTPATSNAPLREGKGWLYEGGLRVPLLVKGPGVKNPGRTVDEPVVSMDIMPTVAALVEGAKRPEPQDGTSLVPVLDGSGKLGRESLYWHYPHYANQGGRPGGVVRTGNWKLVQFYENNRLELFNLAKDSGESSNLSASEPARVQEMAHELARWRESVGAKMPRPNADYVPNPQAADGSVTLPARTATVHGIQLRYEPQPHKNTLGFWVREEDSASWDFTISKPGRFRVVALVGCGPGQGGSLAGFQVDDGPRLELTVPDTGGFQAFRPMELGQVEISAGGHHKFLVKPIRKAKAAVMDVREVRLIPAQ